MSAPDARHPVIRTIEVLRAPGLPDRFRLDGLGPGVTIVTGPNGSGKSTTARLIQRLFWHKAEDDGADVRFDVAYDGGEWLVERHGTRVDAARNGVVQAFPLADTQSPEMRRRYLLALHDLLVGSEDQVFAARVADEMRGGYNVELAARALGFTSARARHKPESDNVTQARKALRERRQAQEALAAQEGDLVRLAEEIADADRAANRVRELDAIADALEAAGELAAAQAAIAALPPTLAHVIGDEPERLAAWARERRALEIRQTDLETERQRAADDLARAAVEAGPALDLALDSASRRRDALRDLENQRQQTTRDLESSRARRVVAAADVGARLPDPLAGREGVVALEELARALAVREQADRFAAELGTLQSVIAGRAARVEVAPLNAGIDALVRWLQTPPPPDASHLAATRRLVLIAWAAGGVVVLLALVLAVAVHPGFALAILIGAVVVGAGWHVGKPAPTHDPRPERQADYVRTGQPAPATWDEASVRDQLDRQVAAVRTAEVGNGFAAEVDRLGPQILRAQQAAQDRAREVAEVAARHGIPLDGISSATDVAILVDRLKALLAADDQIAALDARLVQLGQERGALMATIGAELAPYRVAPADDLPTLEAVLEALRRRSEQAARAAVTLATVERELEHSVAPQLARIDRERAELFARLEIADDAAAVALAARLPAWRTATARLQTARATADDRRHRAGVDLAGWDAERVAHERDAAVQRASRLRSATEERKAIELRIEAAKSATDLGDAIATLATASAALADKYDHELGRLIGWEIAESVRAQTQQANLPQVMRIARDIFARITRERYELQIDPTTQEFRARDVVHGGSLALEQLSSATRVQLLLAVRAAFVEVFEQGVRLPLLLDETLANADEERAEAIIHAVFDLARDGRQIFYFTAQEDEVGKWRQLAAGEQGGPLQVIDLRDARALEASRDGLVAMPPAGRRLPPAPDGRDWAAYGVMLGVPAVDPWAEATSWHLWRLVDDVGDLHTLLTRGIDTVGRASFALDRLGDDGLGIPAINGAALRARITVATRLVALWRQGRGRPATWADIAATGEVSASFSETAPPLFEACGRDAGTFVARLREGELRNFRRTAIDRIEEKLRAQGFIADEHPLTADDLRMQIIVAAATALDAGAVSVEVIDRWLAALQPGPAAAVVA